MFAMQKVQITEYQGKKIIQLNFSMLKSEEEIATVIKESIPFIRDNSSGSVCVISNLEGMHFNNRIRDMFTEFTKGNKNYVKASAIIGATGLQTFMINGINKVTGRKLKSFDNLQLAKDWLVSQN